MRLLHRLFAGALAGWTAVAAAQGPALDAELPPWAREAWAATASARGLALSDRINPFVWRGDFDGDGRADFAILVKNTASGKEGIAILLRRNAAAIVVGAGRDFGNGGDDFSWMDWWSVEDRARGQAERGGAPRDADALIVGKEGAASALISVARGRPTWRQQGD